jgi:hypothetical protein
MRVDMINSIITLRDGNTTYRILGPNMRLTLTSKHVVDLHFKQYRDHWRLQAPFGTAGEDFLNAMAYRFDRGLHGGIKNVAWSAKFFSQSGGRIRWRWSASAYTSFTSRYRQLDVKPLDDTRYPPYNADRAGTPEAYKQFATSGGTDGAVGASVDLTPCRR